MRINWKGGFFRVWLVVTLAWIGLAGWNEVAGKASILVSPTSTVHMESDCWKRLAKWPNGQPFDEWESWGAEELDIPANVEINKKKGAWAAESIAVRNQWVRATRQKVMECEAAAPILQRASFKAADIATDISLMKDSLLLVLLPPCALLLAGCIFAWIMQGFRATA